MLEFLQENIGTIIVSILLLLRIFFAVKKIYTDKKNGKNSCSGDCSSCAGCAYKSK